MLAYVMLRACDASRFEAGTFAALSAFFFYPPNGTPFMDQHAFFFTAAALFAVYQGSVADTPQRARAWWIALPWLVALGFLSKQIPTAFAALAIVGWIAINPKRAREWIAPIAIGVLTVAIAIAAVWLITDFSLRDAWTSLVVMPLDIAAERTPGESPTAPLRIVLGTTRRLAAWSHLWAMYVVVAGLVALVVSRRAATHRLETLWLLASMVITTGAFSAYTLNQLENGYCLLMLATGMAVVSLRRLTVSVVSPARTRAAAVSISALLSVIALRDTVVFARGIDATRAVLDTTFDPAVAERARPYLLPALRFMAWTDVRCNAEEFSRLVVYLTNSPHNFVLLSDFNVLYALTGKPSVSPALWLHPGLTIPYPRTPGSPAFEERLLARMRAMDARYVLIEEPATGRYLTLTDFPQLAALVESKGCGEQRFGSVRVVELCE
jgi:hypothetical protein